MTCLHCGGAKCSHCVRDGSIAPRTATIPPPFPNGRPGNDSPRMWTEAEIDARITAALSAESFEPPEES